MSEAEICFLLRLNESPIQCSSGPCADLSITMYATVRKEKWGEGKGEERGKGGGKG